MNRVPASLLMAIVLATACRRPPPEDPAEQIYRGAVQMFAQASAASHDLTYRDPRFDAVLTELAKVPEGSEFRTEADALAKRIRTAREQAAAADEESRKAIDQALAQPTFESQGRLDATQGSTMSPRVATPRTVSAPAQAPPPMPPPDPGPSQSNAARALQRSLAAGAQEPADDPPALAPEGDNSAPDETAGAPPAAPNPRSPPPPPTPPPPPPTPPGQVFGLPGPAGRAMGTRP